MRLTRTDCLDHSKPHLPSRLHSPIITMKVNALALASATLVQYSAAKELKPTSENLELYESGTRHHEIMSIKHVCLSHPMNGGSMRRKSGLDWLDTDISPQGQMGRSNRQRTDGLYTVQEPPSQGSRHLHGRHCHRGR